MKGKQYETASTLAQVTDQSAIAGERIRRAVFYLRVSTPSQVNTDYNPEGISLPAQRDACQVKADSLGAEVAREFVEPGRSATTIDKRPVFQEMLAWLKDNRNDIDYVIVYQFNRMFRNTIDAAITKRDLRKWGVRLVSTIMDLGEGPEGDMVEAIMNAVDEYRSRADGADISFKMSRKAKSGGTVGKAPIGYLNVRDTSEGRNIGTVVVDPVRGPLVTTAFELYATGDYSIDELAEHLTDRGLRTKRGRYPDGSISTSGLNKMLRDRYYAGVVRYKEEEHPGCHPKLVSDELFERVQERLDERGGEGKRKRIHHHYLKGLVWCGSCHEDGCERRLLQTVSRGRAGDLYEYFFCRGRQDHLCVQPHIPAGILERAVEHYWRTLKLSAELIDGVRQLFDETLAEKEQCTKLRHQQFSAEVTRLDGQEENLLNLIADGSVDLTKTKARLRTIQQRRAKLSAQLEDTDDRLSDVAQYLGACAELLRDPGELYRRCSEGQRQRLNGVLFQKLYIKEEFVVAAVLRAPFDDLIGIKKRALRQDTASAPDALCSEPHTPTLSGVVFGGGSNKALVVRSSRLGLTCAFVV